MKEERRTSETPYCPVDSIKCRENAIPGSTLTKWLVNESVRGPRADCVNAKGEKKKANFLEDGTHFEKKTRAVAGRTL